MENILFGKGGRKKNSIVPYQGGGSSEGSGTGVEESRLFQDMSPQKSNFFLRPALEVLQNTLMIR